MKKGIKEKSADTLIVENRLRNTSPGDIVTYSELTKLLGRDVREFCRGNINTARSTLVYEGVNFDTISGEGLKRLDGGGSVVASQSSVRKAKSAANKGMKILAHVEFAELSPEMQKKHLALSSQLGAVAMFSGSKATKKIESSVNGKQMAIGETLKLFGG